MQSFPLQNISIEQVIAWEQALSQVRNEGGDILPEERIPYIVSLFILRHFFGLSWCERNVMLRSLPGLGSTKINFFGAPWTEKRFDSDVAKFMRTHPQNLKDQGYHQIRIRELAEMLFNFQGVEGVSSLFEMIGKGQKNIEANYFVLQAARLVYFNNIPFRFVIPDGTKGGKNYDAELILANGATAYCEMKCKFEQTSLSKGAILRRLQRSREQLPKDEMGIVFISIPDAWLYEKQILPMLSGVLTEFFRNTKRIVSVIVCVEEWQMFGRQLVRILTPNEIVNRGAIHSDKYPTYGILSKTEEPPPSKYKRLADSPVRDMPFYPYFIVPFKK